MGNFGETSGKFPKFRKVMKIFPGKFPENSRKNETILTVKCDVTERKSCFYFCKRDENRRNFQGKFRGKFPKCQKFPEEISPKNFPKIPGSFFG